LVVIGKIRLPKVEQPKFEGHMTPNKNKYQKSVRLKIQILSWSIIMHHWVFWLQAYIPADEIDFEIGHFCNFGPLWPWPWIGSYGKQLCITHRPLSTYQILLKSEKVFVNGH